MFDKLKMNMAYKNGMKLFDKALTKDGFEKLNLLKSALNELIRASNFLEANQNIYSSCYNAYKALVNFFVTKKSFCTNDDYKYNNYVKTLYDNVVAFSKNMIANKFEMTVYSDKPFEAFIKTSAKNCNDYAMQLKQENKFESALNYFNVSKELGFTTKEKETTYCQGQIYYNNGLYYSKKAKYKEAMQEFSKAEKCNISCRNELYEASELYYAKLGDYCYRLATGLITTVSSALDNFNDAKNNYIKANKFSDNHKYDYKISDCEKGMEDLGYPCYGSSYGGSGDHSDYSSSNSDDGYNETIDAISKGEQALQNGDCDGARRQYRQAYDYGYLHESDLKAYMDKTYEVEEAQRQNERDRFEEEQKLKDAEHQAYYDEMGIDQ